MIVWLDYKAAANTTD
jgi:cation diffusion facilitator CzcD-associated flavoprotein CzcO